MKFNVIEIFDSIEGEGIRQGLPATFIRLGGCNLNCTWCDTRYACNPKNFIPMDLEKIVARVNPHYKRVTLTGGEPLMHEGVEELIKALVNTKSFVNIETNGAIDLSKLKIDTLGTMFTMDYKLPSSGQKEKMIWDNFINADKNYFIKFVVGSDGDLLELERIITEVTEFRNKNKKELPVFLATAVAGEYNPKNLADYILQNPLLKNVILQVQLHKVIGVK